MQVRIANKQDEADIRTFVDAFYRLSGSQLNLDSVDSDLRNVEASYFGKEGLFLVAEHEGKIVGVAGARKKTESELEWRRLMVSAPFESDEVVSELVEVIVEFAPRMLYERIEAGFVPPSKHFSRLLAERGFQPLEANDGRLGLSIRPNF